MTILITHQLSLRNIVDLISCNQSVVGKHLSHYVPLVLLASLVFLVPLVSLVFQVHLKMFKSCTMFMLKNK